MQELWWWVSKQEKQRENQDKSAGTARSRRGAVLQGCSSVTLQLEHLACLGLKGNLGGTQPKFQKKMEHEESLAGWSWVDLRRVGGEISLRNIF